MSIIARPLSELLAVAEDEDTDTGGPGGGPTGGGPSGGSSGGADSTPPPSYTRRGLAYDYAIGDIPLVAANSKEYPFQRETAPFRKDQFDASSNPGEQSLSGWWLRSQSSFHEGAGLTFMEPVSDETIANAFMDSKGIDPWTEGRAALLRKAILQRSDPTSSIQVLGAISNSTDMYLHASGTSVFRITDASSTALTWGGSDTVLSMAEDGTNYYVADAVGIYKGTLAGGPGSLVWNTGGSNVVIRYAKQRLVAGIGNAIYELAGSGPSLPTALYSHPNPSWKWTSITEGPQAIYAAGYAGGNSAIVRFSLSTTGAMPTLTSAIIAATLPTGEVVHSMDAYLGAYAILGTNKGVRIGFIDTNGDITYGPLLIESSSPVYGVVGRGRFAYATATNAIDNTSGLWRIDLGNGRDDGSFPYATDLCAEVAGTATGVSVFGASDRMVFAVGTSGSYLESADELVNSGWLRTGFIRFNTIEMKRFQYVSVRGNGAGGIAVETYDADGDFNGIVTLDGLRADDFSLGRAASDEYLALRITLSRSATTAGPWLRSWQVKALPQNTRSRIIRVPVLLFENMRDHKGSAFPPVDVYETLTALENLEDTSRPTLFTELVNSPRSELVVVEQVSFQETTSPGPNAKGYGGILYLTLRTIG